MKYKIGMVYADHIEWGEDILYDKGSHPKISLNDLGEVIEVHQSEHNDSLYCLAGKINLDEKRIVWGAKNRYSNGTTPSVSLNNNGLVVEVHQSAQGSRLYYHVGQLTGNKVQWGTPHKYQDGLRPEIMLTNDRKIVEIHESENHTGIWKLLGYVNNKNIILISNTLFDPESNLRMEMTNNEEIAVYVHDADLKELNHSASCVFRNFFELMTCCMKK
jgi:hypothetical protein